MNIKFNRDKTPQGKAKARENDYLSDRLRVTGNITVKTPFGKRVIAANEVTELKAKKQAKKGD